MRFCGNRGRVKHFVFKRKHFVAQRHDFVKNKIDFAVRRSLRAVRGGKIDNVLAQRADFVENIARGDGSQFVLYSFEFARNLVLIDYARGFDVLAER